MATKYEEIASDLRERINSGEYPPGTTLPSYDELTESYGASKVTIRTALNMLETDGLVRPVKKLGLVVRDPGQRRRVSRGTTVTRSSKAGYVFPAASGPGEKWVPHGRPRRALLPVPADVASALDVPAGTETVRRRRVTSPENEAPFQLVDSWIHPDVVREAPQVAEPSTGPGGYLDRIEEAGHGPLSWTEVMRTRMPSREEARLLEIPTSMPVLVLTTVGTSARTGGPVEATVRVIPGDRVEVMSELRRDRTARWPVASITPDRA